MLRIYEFLFYKKKSLKSNSLILTLQIAHCHWHSHIQITGRSAARFTLLGYMMTKIPMASMVDSVRLRLISLLTMSRYAYVLKTE